MKTKYFKLNTDLSVKKLPNYIRLFRVSALFNVILILGLSYSFINPQVLHVKTVTVVEKEVPEDIKLNDSSITKELQKAGVSQVAIAVAQAKLETGHYKSLVCKENKNLFGIKAHKCKYVLGSKNNHACYNTYRDNIKCYAHIQDMYLKQIDGKYASAPDYLQQLKTVR
jgi:regulatory protein YycI of two-component signal transduction system YycFG